MPMADWYEMRSVRSEYEECIPLVPDRFSSVTGNVSLLALLLLRFLVRVNSHWWCSSLEMQHNTSGLQFLQVHVVMPSIVNKCLCMLRLETCNWSGKRHRQWLGAHGGTVQNVNMQHWCAKTPTVCNKVKAWLPVTQYLCSIQSP